MRRGRPRHDDVLTPREWEVLDLLREGLTNEQIAGRLGVSLDTAKFHVSEILGKLGVESRQEAAAWQGRPKKVPILDLSLLLARLQAVSPLRLAGVSIIGAALLAFAALALGTTLFDPRSNPEPTPEPEPVTAYTGIEGLDVIIDSLLEDDATDLAARFAGVEAREGALVGGPVGLYQPQPVFNADWTARLGAASRALHAVVQDPVEPFEWWMQPPQPSPRAAVLDAPRDYDIVLIVGPGDDSASAWRFSVTGAHVIDIVIENQALNPGGPSSVPLVTRLGNLTPSPDDEPASFLVLPPEERRPPPAGLGSGSGLGGAPEPPDAPVEAPSIAPDGRTGDPALDALIQSLLDDDAATLAQKYAGLAARRQFCDPSCDDGRVPAPEWSALLAAAGRSLYAVTTDDPADAEVMLAVDSGLGAAEAWAFKVVGGRPAELRILIPWLTAIDRGFFHMMADYTPSPARDYERFYVLPPREMLPTPPPGHALSTRTGHAGVDGLLDLLEARDGAGLYEAFASTEDFPVLQCFSWRSPEGAAYLREWADELAADAVSLHAVADVPPGYPLAAGHVLVLVAQVKPLWWQVRLVFEADGEIVAVSAGEWCNPEQSYPPPAFLVPAPASLGELDTARRSGIPSVDAFLDALQGGDEAALDAMIDYPLVNCVVQMDDGSPPGCPPGVAPGTALEGIQTGGCGVSSLRDDVPRALIDWLTRRQAGLYAVIPVGPSGRVYEVPATHVLVLAGATEIQPNPAWAATPMALGTTRVIFNGDRIVDFSGSGCGAFDALWLLFGEPSFLLAPP